MSDYSVTLSTTEPNNYVGLIKLRQGDVASQSIQATITANGQLFNFDHLAVFFNAVLPNGNVVRDKVTEVDYINSKLNYIVADSFLQEVTQVTAWFSFENDEKIIDSTKNFQYSVIGGWKECIPQGNYIYELSEIQRQIEEIIGNKDFTTLLSELDFLKTNIAYLDNNIKTIGADLNNSINDKLSQISSVPETFANLAALKSKYPTGKTGLFVTADNGHKYIWANNAWTDAGVYQSVGIAENSLDLTKIIFNASELIGWDENAISISPTGFQANGTPITITFNAGCTWTLSGNMASYVNDVTVEKTIPDGYGLYLDVTKFVNGNGLTADSYIIAKYLDIPQKWSNILLALNVKGRLLSPVQALQNKLSRNYYGLKDLTVPVSNILFYASDNQYPIKIEDHDGTGATITFNTNTVIYSNNFGRFVYFPENMTFDLKDGQSLILNWLDAPDSNIESQVTAGDFTIGQATTLTSDYKHHLLLSYLSHKLVSHNVSLQIAIDNYYHKRMVNSNYNNVITVGQGHEHVTIQDAVNAAADSKDNPVTILIMPGIYNESIHVGGQRHLSLIGVNKKTCIVRNDTGYYNDAPLEIEGDAMIKNLTFISTHDATPNVPVDSLRSYAVHADFPGAGTTEFIDCDMISMQNAAFGCGLRQDQTVKLIRCNLFSHTPIESSMLANGSLFCHSAIDANTSNQHLIVDGCHVESDLSWAIYIADVNQTFGDKTGTDMDVAFYRNLFYSHEKGKTDIIHKESGTGFSGTIKLNPMSYGNNLPELNG